MAVERAAEVLKNSGALAGVVGAGEEKRRTVYSPMGIVGAVCVMERVRGSLEELFVLSVDGGSSVKEGILIAGIESDTGMETPVSAVDEAQAQVDAEAEKERKKTSDAARSLGGKMAELGDLLEKIWSTGVSDLGEAFPGWAPSLSFTSTSPEADEEAEGEAEEAGLEAEIKALLRALILYRKVFPTHAASRRVPVMMLSPPPSPGSKDRKMQYALRKALGSAVFDRGEENERLEGARDRVVDLIVEGERRKGGMD
jgi:hypothetical protein